MEQQNIQPVDESTHTVATSERINLLKKEFESILSDVPENQINIIGSKLLDDLWDSLYIKKLPSQSVIIGNDPSKPIPVLKARKISVKNPSQFNVQEHCERLAMLRHHNCALKPKENETPFSQALRTIFMKSPAPLTLLGKYDDWAYLKDRNVEPVSYNIPSPNKSKFLSKAWRINTEAKIYKFIRSILFKHDLEDIKRRNREKLAIDFLESHKGQV